MKAKGKWVWIVSFISIISCLLFAAGLGDDFIYDYVSATSKGFCKRNAKAKAETSSSNKSTRTYADCRFRRFTDKRNEREMQPEKDTLGI